MRRVFRNLSAVDLFRRVHYVFPVARCPECSPYNMPPWVFRIAGKVQYFLLGFYMKANQLNDFPIIIFSFHLTKQDFAIRQRKRFNVQEVSDGWISISRILQDARNQNRGECKAIEIASCWDTCMNTCRTGKFDTENPIWLSFGVHR